MNVVEYQFPFSSNLFHSESKNKLLLSHQSELEELNQTPCFFWGKLTEPYLTVKCLLIIAKVVRTSFLPTPPRLRDPIISAGAEQLRFEGFSSCNSVYARLDLKPEAIDGEFLASGTTNVDFNEPLLNELSKFQINDKLSLAVGEKEFQISTSNSKIVEQKVKLPERWIKGLASVQIYLAEMNQVFGLNKIQTLQLFQTIPKGTINGDFYISFRGGKYLITKLPTEKSVRIGSIYRLRLLESILGLIEKMYIFESRDKETCGIICEFGKLQLLITFSPENLRGFSGEGKVLDKLTEDLPIKWIVELNHLLKTNEKFDPFLFSSENNINYSIIENLSVSLSSIGLLGFDLLEGVHFYRRLPFKIKRLLDLNPRLKNAKQLIENSKIEILNKTKNYTEALVHGKTGIYKVILEGFNEKCTCEWFSKYQGKRGICKHILGVRLYEKN